MNAKEANVILRQKARMELRAFQRHLLTQSQQVVLDHAYEYATKSDMVTIIGETEFNEEQAKAMLKVPKLLDRLFREYGNHSGNSVDVLLWFMTDKAEAYAEAKRRQRSHDITGR